MSWDPLSVIASASPHPLNASIQLLEICQKQDKKWLITENRPRITYLGLASKVNKALNWDRDEDDVKVEFTAQHIYDTLRLHWKDFQREEEPNGGPEGTLGLPHPKWHAWRNNILKQETSEQEFQGWEFEAFEIMYYAHLGSSNFMSPSFPAEVATRMNTLAAPENKDWGRLRGVDKLVHYDAESIRKRLDFHIGKGHLQPYTSSRE